MCPYVRVEGRERRLEGTARSAMHPFLSSLIINLMRAKAKKKTKNIIAMSAGKMCSSFVFHERTFVSYFDQEKFI